MTLTAPRPLLAIASLALSGVIFTTSHASAAPLTFRILGPSFDSAAALVSRDLPGTSFPAALLAPAETMNWDGDYQHARGPSSDVVLRFSIEDTPADSLPLEYAMNGAADLSGPALDIPMPQAPALSFPPGTASSARSGKVPNTWFDPKHEQPQARYIMASSGTSYRQLKLEAQKLLRNPPRSLRGASDLACIAVAIYHEARDQSTYGQLAVASVIQQRARVPGRWGDNVCEVIRPVQFSFMTSRYGYPPILEAEAWATAVSLAMKSLIDGPLPELRDADHYHANYSHPDWRLRMERIGQIGDHIFYRDPDSAGPHT